MERRTWRDAAGPLVATLAGTAAAALVSLAGGGAESSALPWLPDTTLRAQPAPRVLVYTNADLDRVHALRAEPGVDSQPAVVHGEGACQVDSGRGARRGRGRKPRAGTCAPDADAGSAAPPGGGGAVHDEAYWRREAERVRDKLRLWRQQIDDLELKIADRRRKPRVAPYTDPQILGWQRRADTLRARMRELEGDLDDRARRERALPGWLR